MRSEIRSIVWSPLEKDEIHRYFEASTTHLFKIQAIFLQADDPSLLLSATFQVAFRAWNLLELLILRRK